MYLGQLTYLVKGIKVINTLVAVVNPQKLVS